VRVFDIISASDGVQKLAGHALDASLTMAVFSRDGAFAISGGKSTFLYLWDAGTGALSCSLYDGKASAPYGQYKSVAFSPDGKFVHAWTVKGVFVADATTGEVKESYKGWKMPALWQQLQAPCTGGATQMDGISLTCVGRVIVRLEGTEQAKLIITHPFFRCDGCKAMPIVGARFECAVCDNYDLCEQCEKDGVHASTAHPLAAVKEEG
jgi:hypothetical protein